jgi:hypothetical protein
MRVPTKLACLAAGSLLVLSAGAASAQETAPADTPAVSVPAERPARKIERRYGFDLLTGAIEPGAAETAGTGDRLYGAQFSVGIIAYRVLSVSGDFGIVGMRDEAQFTQETNMGKRSSGVAAGMATLAVGLRTPPLGLGIRDAAVSAGVSAGRSWMDVNRDIGNCMDCHAEDVRLAAGEFWEPGVHLTWGRHGISARYRSYHGTSDVRDALMIGLTGSF